MCFTNKCVCKEHYYTVQIAKNICQKNIHISIYLFYVYPLHNVHLFASTLYTDIIKLGLNINFHVATRQWCNTLAVQHSINWYNTLVVQHSNLVMEHSINWYASGAEHQCCIPLVVQHTSGAITLY